MAEKKVKTTTSKPFVAKAKSDSPKVKNNVKAGKSKRTHRNRAVSRQKRIIPKKD